MAKDKKPSGKGTAAKEQPGAAPAMAAHSKDTKSDANSGQSSKASSKK